MNDRKPTIQLQLRLPADVKDWLKAEAEKNCSSQNSEIVRSVLERMERTTAPTA